MSVYSYHVLITFCRKVRKIEEKIAKLAII